MEPAKQGDARVPGKWPAASPSAPGERLPRKGNCRGQESGSSSRGTPPIRRGRRVSQESGGAASTSHRSSLSIALEPGAAVKVPRVGSWVSRRERDRTKMDAAWAPGGRAPLCFQSAPYRLMMSLAESRSCPSARSCAHTLGHPPSPYTHTLIASLASPHGEGPLVVFALVWWGTVDVNTVNSLCSDTSAWTRRVQDSDPPPKTPWEDLPLFN